MQLLAGETGGIDRLRFGEVGLVAGRLVEPRRPPSQFVVEAAEGVVVSGRVGNAVGILPPIGVGEGVKLAGVLHEQVGIDRVGRPEHDRGRGQCRRRLARHIGAGARGIELVRRPAHRHHFGCPPEGMVGTAIADLSVKHIRRRMRLDEPVGAPLDRIEHLRQQAAGGVGIAVLHDAEAEERHRRRHREGKLHMVAGVVIAAAEIDPHIRAVGERRVAPPVEREVGGQIARALGVIKQQRLLQHVGVVIGPGLGGIVIDDRAGAGVAAGEDRGRKRRAEPHDQRLIRLDRRVAGDDNGDRLRQFAGGEGERAAGGRVIRAGGRGAVGGRILHRDRLGRGGGEAHRERQE